MTKANKTRHLILTKSFELIYARGYQSVSIDDIIATTGLTKGAFYYHFKNKDEMGVAIINELMRPQFEGIVIRPLLENGDPLPVIYQIFENMLLNDSSLIAEYGCPVSNLVQEMAPWNEQFTAELTAAAEEWRAELADSLRRGQENGFVRTDIDVHSATLFVLAGYWGVRNIGKVTDARSAYKSYLTSLHAYLESLRK